MKALSIQQPWCYAILNCGKDIENRTWRTSFRGRIRIHAGKTYDKKGEEFLKRMGFDVPANLPQGALVGEVDIVDCKPVEEVVSGWAFGPMCFRLENIEAYDEPIPCKGKLGFFTPDDALLSD